MEMQYVYQMCLSIEEDSIKLKFPNEIDTFATPVFVIPFNREFGNTLSLSNEFYFPGQVGDIFKNFKLIKNKQNYILNDSMFNYPLKFEINTQIAYKRVKSNNGRRYVKREILVPQEYEYIGSLKSFIEPSMTFAIIEPIDIYLMDKLYLEQGISLIGLCPNFNNREAFSF